MFVRVYALRLCVSQAAEAAKEAAAKEKEKQEKARQEQKAKEKKKAAEVEAKVGPSLLCG